MGLGAEEKGGLGLAELCGRVEKRAERQQVRS